MKKVIKITYENEIPALRFAKIACPSCDVVFSALSHGKTEYGGYIHDYIDLQYGIYKCPNCKFEFETRDQNLEMEER